MSLALRRPSSISRTYRDSQPSQLPEDIEEPAVPISEFVNEDFESPLSVKYVNFNVERNGALHKTSLYAHMHEPSRNALVVKRGQPFRITIGLTRTFCLRDHITLVFHNNDLSKTNHDMAEDSVRSSFHQVTKVVHPPKSSFGNKTKCVVPVIAAPHHTIGSTSRWGAACDSVGKDYIEVLVQAADDCIVGRWHMDICIEHCCGGVEWYHDSRKTTIFILFNSYCRGDDVFLEQAIDRVEYVEETLGMIFSGCDQHVTVSFCTFSQYEDPVLDVAVQILVFADANIDVAERNSATKVVQVITHTILHTGKVLKYSGKNLDDPWSSASRVLHEYQKKRKPVVYNDRKTAIIVLTAMNFKPAKDRLTKSSTATSNDSEVSKLTRKKKSSSSSFTMSDPLRNLDDGNEQKQKIYHKEFIVEAIKPHEPWVEVFVLRKDLPDADKGWQAVTPFGPVSIHAVQNCDYHKEYDTLFFCRKINSLYAYYSRNHKLKCHVPQNEVIGRLAPYINTKKPSQETFGFLALERSYQFSQDIMNEAKKVGYNQESSQIAQAHATTPSSVIMHFVGKKLQGLSFWLTPIKNVMLGDTILIQVSAASNDRRVEWQASVCIILYTVSSEGVMLKKINRSSMKINKMTDGGSARVAVPYSEYSGKIPHGGLFRVIVIAWGSGTSEGFYLMDDFFSMSIPSPMLFVTKEGVTVTCVNTLSIPMKQLLILIYELGDTTPGVKFKVPMLTEALGKVGGNAGF